MISLCQLSKRFDAHLAVDQLSLEVQTGETLVLLGTSGCGKTTTLKMINGLVEPDSGTVEIDGARMSDCPRHEWRRKIGYVIQETGLFPHYRVEENVAVVPRLLGWTEERIRKRTLELLEMLRLPAECLQRYPDQLSGGQRQRVGLARALAADPPVVLMDEPLGALDPVTRLSIRREFRELAELRRKTIILVTHDVQEAFEMGDRIGLMDQGRLQQVGTPKELLRQPTNAFVSDFLAGQRFSLLLRAFSLSDIAPYLNAQSTNEVNALLEPGTPLADAIEKVSTGQRLFFYLNGQTFGVDFQEVMQAFEQKITQ
jgi:osmoprotectant transport system ATP-binding protein